MGAITVSGFVAATNTDVLNGTRLVTVGLGRIKVEMIAADNVAANHFVASLTLPDGDAPLLDVLVPGGGTAGLAGVMDERLALIGVYDIFKEGHVTLSLTETGDTEVYWRVTNIT